MNVYGVFIGFFPSCYAIEKKKRKIRARKMRKFHWTVTTLHFDVKNEQLLRIYTRLVDSFAFFHFHFKIEKHFSVSSFNNELTLLHFLGYCILHVLWMSMYVRLIFHSCWKMLMKNFAISCDIINWENSNEFFLRYPC